MKPAPTILYCHCAHADVISAETRRRVMEAIAQSGEACEAVADLCELAARRDPILKQIAEGGPARQGDAVASPVRIIACWPRTVRWLFDYAGAPLPKATVVYNMRKEAAEAILAHIGAGERTTPLRGGSGDPPRDAKGRATTTSGKKGTVPFSEKPEKGTAPFFPAKKPGEWIPWFPVIDYDRCENCRQCLQFCLFGVYAEDEGGKVRVAKPANCKTGCPACARICPHAAIIFPKYAEGSISGDDAPPAAAEGRPEKPIDFSSLAGLDIHEAIRRRSAILRAHQERKSHNE
ncbi:MAG: ferredoxin family protein [Planctomycetota bacterium]|nr:ferredoxin family protein [Planctomycetota bacterium]